jgi:hypothetical protein
MSFQVEVESVACEGDDVDRCNQDSCPLNIVEPIDEDDEGGHLDPISGRPLAYPVMRIKQRDETPHYCYNDNDEDHALRDWVERERRQGNAPRNPFIMTDQLKLPNDWDHASGGRESARGDRESVMRQVRNESPARIGDGGVDYILRHATNEHEAMQLFLAMELNRRFLFGEINSLVANGFGEVARRFAMDTIDKNEDAPDDSFSARFQPESFFALLDNGFDDLANQYRIHSYRRGSPIAPADTSPRFQRGHRVTLHTLIAGENDRNREMAQTAQGAYYITFVKPYEDRDGIDVGGDWRNYNEQWVADQSRT